MGWFYSDGNVAKDFNSASVIVHERDEEVLFKMASLMHTRKPPQRCTDRKATLLYIHSRQLCGRLTELGCVPCKSLVIQYPTFLATREQHKAFLRGVFEGDGFVYSGKDTRMATKVGIASGSLDFMVSVQKVIKKLLGLESVIGLNKSLPRRLRIGHGHLDSLTFLNFLYEDVPENLTMKRKRDLWFALKRKVANPPLIKG